MKITIVGAGIVGLSAAWALLRFGLEVRLIEQATDIPNPLAASVDRQRIIRRAYEPDSGYGRMMEAALDGWNLLWHDLGKRYIVENGVLCVCQNYGDEAEQFRAGLDAVGGSYEVIAAGEARQRFPFLDPEKLKYVFQASDGGVLVCREIAAHLLLWIGAKGCELLCNSRVIQIDPGNGSVRLETGEILKSDQLVVTAGEWTLQLLPEIADQLTPGRTFVIYVAPPPDLASAWASSPAILSVGEDADGYVQPPVKGTVMKFGAAFTSEMNVNPSEEWRPDLAGLERLRNAFSPPIARIGEYRILSSRTCAFIQTGDSRFFCTYIGKMLVVSVCSGYCCKFGQAITEERQGELSVWLRG